jgi:acyl-CoA synthetase (AMP-forming)/AMP-acid ligase II
VHPSTIPQLLRGAALAFGDNEYVVTGDRSLTFAEAERESRLLAKRLLRHGVGKGTVIGILFPQGPDFVVALLAVTRIGAVAVPLSTFQRGPELRRALRHVDVDSLIAPGVFLGRDLRNELEGILPELRRATGDQLFLHDMPYLRRIWLVGASDRPWVTDLPALAELPDEAAIDEQLFAGVESEVADSDRMVIVQTSGATAEPKAVVHTHASQVHQATRLAELYGLASDVRTFTTMPFFWVGGLTVVLLTHLCVGATVITLERADSGEMLDLIERTRPTRLLGWTLVERLRADPSFATRDLRWLTDLNAEATPTGLRHGSLGMTETGGPHTAVPTADNQVDLPAALRGSFGRPVAGVEHRIVDPGTGAPVRDGTEGEIWVRGDILMEGLYKKGRHQTFERDGWYRTGDRGYFRDGYLFFTGRLTEMIKTGGANVAPREVELALESLPGVKAAFVVGIPDDVRGEMVGCLVCPETGHDLDPNEIRAQLGEILSSYKIPRKIIVKPYDEAPWLASGKISKPRVLHLLLNQGR